MAKAGRSGITLQAYRMTTITDGKSLEISNDLIVSTIEPEE
jgi:hypothetical protein